MWGNIQSTVIFSTVQVERFFLGPSYLIWFVIAKLCHHSTKEFKMSKRECLTSKGPAGLNPLVRLPPLTIVQ